MGGTRPWPKKLRNIWLQNFGFLAMALFSALLVTRPIASFVAFIIMVAAATGFAMIWRLRSFCNYLCPISGFLSLYSMAATVELRSVSHGRLSQVHGQGLPDRQRKRMGLPVGRLYGEARSQQLLRVVHGVRKELSSRQYLTVWPPLRDRHSA